MSAEQIADSFAAYIDPASNWRVFPVSFIRDTKESGLYEALDWYVGTIKSEQESKKRSVEKKAVPMPNDPDVLAKKLEDWLKRAEKDSEPAEFLCQFEEIRLPSWDHYTHIRLAFIILVTYGRQKGIVQSCCCLAVR